MANNYSQFSEIIADIKPEEEAWIRNELEIEIPGLSDEEKEKRWEAVAKKYAAEPDYWPDFNWKFENDVTGDSYGTKPGSRHFWLYAEESGNIDNLASFVKEFLKTFRPKTYFTLTWANHCDKLRVGEFDGGGLFVTAKKIVSSTGWGFCEKEADKFKKAHGLTKKAKK